MELLYSTITVVNFTLDSESPIILLEPDTIPNIKQLSLKKNLNASKPSEHSPVRRKNVKTFRWDHRLQRPNLFMAFKRVPRW